MLELDGKLRGTLEVLSDWSLSMVLYSYLVEEGFLKTSFCMTVLTYLMPRNIELKLVF